MPFRFETLDIPGVILVEPVVFPDERGFFMETYKLTDFKRAGIDKPFLQESCSRSIKGTLRGLHYQMEPMPQGKLIRAVTGEIFDVAVDVRMGSPTYGKYVSHVLSDQNRLMLYIPEGFAHGFCVLSEGAEVAYLSTQVYSPDLERGILWNDPEIGIDWPIKEPLLSDKDARQPRLKDIDNNFTYDK